MQTAEEILSGINISSQKIFSGQSSEQEHQTDELTLLLRGNVYDSKILEKYEHEISWMLLTEKYCPDCEGIKYCTTPLLGWQVFYTDKEGSKHPIFKYGRCKYWRQREQQKKEKQLISPRSNRQDFDTFEVGKDNRDAYDVCRFYADDFTRLTQDGLLLMGPPGTGKTHLAVAVAKAVLKKDIPVGFVSVPFLLDDIRSSYGKSDADKVNIMRSVEKRFVIFDDMGAEYLTDWVPAQLYKLIDYRYQHMLPTVVTSNCTIGELERRIGQRTVDRLAEMCRIITVEGRSWRRRKD